MGILDRIGAFRPSPVAGQGQAGGMLTGVAPAEALFARNLGGLLGMDMRSTQEKAQAELQGIDPRDPNAQIKSLEIVAKYGTPEQIQNALIKIQAIQAGRQAAQQQKQYKQSLAARANAIGAEGLVESIQNASTEQLKELSKDLRQEEFKRIDTKRQQGAINAVAATFGLEPQDVKDLSLEEVEKMGTLAEGTDSKRFVIDDNVVQLPTRGGKVFYNNKWSFAEDVGALEEDPRVTQVITKAGRIGSGVEDIILKDFAETYDFASGAYQQAVDNNRSLELVDKGIYTGTFGNLKTELDKALSVLSGGLIDPSQTAVNTIEFVQSRAQKVLDRIKALGSGTGISNADLNFTKDMVGADISSVTEENVIRLLGIERDALELGMERFNREIDYLKDKDALDAADIRLMGKIRQLPPRQAFDKQDLTSEYDLSNYGTQTQELFNRLLRQGSIGIPE
jgi:hypothetical protein